MAMPTGRAATIIDVANLAGVSKSTASRVLTGTGRVSSAAVAVVTRAADELHYVANPAARALITMSGTRVVVGAVSPRATLSIDAYLSQVVSAAAAACGPERIGVGLQALSLAGPDPFAELGRDPTVQGVVLVNTTSSVLAAAGRALPGRIVSIGVGSAAVPSIDVDNGAGAETIVRHLLESGRRRIAMVTGPQWLPCIRRPVTAYQQLMRDAGLSTRIVAGDFTPESGRTAAAAALRRWPDLDAIVAICDDTALGVLAELRSRGVEVPGDVAVVGFDDIPFAEFAGLTTATHPVERIADTAARTLLQGRTDRAADVVFGSELVLRQSA
jgi:DNA-binding LacI/PurR family transcriptional regulator